MQVLFADRAAAGVALGEALAEYRGADVVVVGLPRGGVVTAKEVAAALDAPLDLVITRKLRHPEAPEFAVGAVTEDGEVVLDERHAAELPAGWLEREEAAQLREARRRRQAYLGGRAPLPVAGKVVIVVDDGIATGYTMKAAIQALRKQRPAKIVVAAPVAPPAVAERFAGLADDMVILHEPAGFFAISPYYRDFTQVDDRDVIALLGPERAS